MKKPTSQAEAFLEALTKDETLQKAFGKAEVLEDIVALATKRGFKVDLDGVKATIRGYGTWDKVFAKVGVEQKVSKEDYFGGLITVSEAELERYKVTSNSARCDSATVLSCFSCATGTRIGCPLC